ncbi:MAG: hypothetical protein ACI9MC_002519, partial [Kiritimatiellia bacterium]
RRWSARGVSCSICATNGGHVVRVPSLLFYLSLGTSLQAFFAYGLEPIN